MVIMSGQGNLWREMETFFFKKTGNLEQKSATSKMENLLFELQRDE